MNQRWNQPLLTSQWHMSRDGLLASPPTCSSQFNVTLLPLARLLEKSNKHSYLKFPIHEYMFPNPHDGALQLHCPPLIDTCSSPLFNTLVYCWVLVSPGRTFTSPVPICPLQCAGQFFLSLIPRSCVFGVSLGQGSDLCFFMSITGF